MQTGIIGFFDILGYQSFLENNRGDGAQQVLSYLAKLEEALPGEMLKALSYAQAAEKAQELVALIKWLVFSDTIMLYTPFLDTDSLAQRSNRWIVMHLACLLLWRRMFEYGLPLRGVIHTGEFLVQKNCFAGIAIAEAYTLSQDLDLAVCVYSPQAFIELIKQANEPVEPLLWRYIPTQIFEYQAPRKTPKQPRLAVINPLTLILNGQERYSQQDMGQIVYECLIRHNKDIPPKAQSKLDNTEQFMRAAKYIVTQDQNEAARRMLRYKKE